jgi:ankyrin repeat protein
MAVELSQPKKFPELKRTVAVTFSVFVFSFNGSTAAERRRMKVGPGELKDYQQHKSIIIVDNKKESDNQVIKKLGYLYSWHNCLVNEDERVMKAGRILVEGQMNDHVNISTFLHTINGDLENLKKTLKEDYLLSVKGTINEKKALKELSDILNIRDTVGGAIIHIAYLYGKYEIGRYLVNLHPESATIVYETPEILQRISFLIPAKQIGPYIGENILHMVISQRQYTETAWLLNFFMEYDKNHPRHKLLPTLLSAKTIGRFFQPSLDHRGNTSGENTLYFGEYPILFAVCANDIRLVRLLLLGNPNYIFIRDSHGNNCLHMCVLHNLPGMYNYLLDLAKEILQKNRFIECDSHNSQPELSVKLTNSLNNLLVDVPNHEGQTPFTLAASLGQIEIFQTLIKHRKTTIWTYGPVGCCTINLRGFDTPDSSEGVIKDIFNNGNAILSLRNTSFISTPSKITFEEKKQGTYLMLQPLGAIDCICRHGHLELLDIPEVREIIEKKWDRFGHPMFMTQAIIILILAALITLIILTNGSNYSSHKEYYIRCLYVVIWVILTLRGLSQDLRHILTYGIEFWGWSKRIRGAALLNNWCVTLEYIFFTIACVFKFLSAHHHSLDRSLIKIFIALFVFIIWIHMYYILMGLETTGSFVVIVSAILYNDFPQFAKLYIVLLLAFGSAYSMLILSHHEDLAFDEALTTHFTTLWNIFVYTVDGQSSDAFNKNLIDRNSNFLFEIIVAAYNLSCVLLLLNLLIAMMTTTYSNYVEKAHMILNREKYNIMVNFERSLSKISRKALQEKYAIIKSRTRDGGGDGDDEHDEREEISVEMHEMNFDWSHLSDYSPESLSSMVSSFSSLCLSLCLSVSLSLSNSLFSSLLNLILSNLMSSLSIKATS